MAKHQPGVWPHYRHVIGDVSRIRGAGADIDHGDAAMIGLYQMTSRHLRRALGSDPHRAAAQASVADDDVTRLDESIASRVAGRHAFATDPGEGVDVELVVGEDDEI